MTPKERVEAFLQGQPIDRVPCVPFILNHAARALGVKVSEYNQNAEVMARAHVAAFRKYGQDMIMVFTDCNILGEAMGAKLYFPEDDVSRVEEPAVHQPAEVEDMAPADPRQDGRLPLLLEATAKIVEEIGDEVLVCCLTVAPFTTAATLRSTDMLGRDLIRQPEVAHKLLQVSQQASLRFVDAIAETGAIPAMVDPVATGNVLSARHFAEFAEPYIRPLVERIAEKGVPAILHICGETAHLWQGMLSTGAAAFSVDKVELEEAARELGQGGCVLGNVRPAETMLQGTPEQVDEEAKGCLEAGKAAARGFILATGCEVPLNSPPENILALTNAARKYGQYQQA